jgi:hypothetical protein
MVNYPPLGPLDDRAIERDQADAQDDWEHGVVSADGFLAITRRGSRPRPWILAATKAFASRLAEPIVGADPGHAGGAVFRLLEAQNGTAAVEIAPARVEVGVIVTALWPLEVMMTDPAGNVCRADWARVDFTETEAQVDLGIGPITTLPAIALRWGGLPSTVAVPCPLPAALGALSKDYLGASLLVSASPSHGARMPTMDSS